MVAHRTCVSDSGYLCFACVEERVTRARTQGTSDRRRWYYWISARDPETGKPYLVFGGQSEDEARSKGMEMLPGVNFELKRFPTRDLDTASHMIKGGRLEETHSLKKAGERLGHEKTIARRRRKGFNVPSVDNIW